MLEVAHIVRGADKTNDEERQVSLLDYCKKRMEGKLKSAAELSRDGDSLEGRGRGNNQSSSVDRKAPLASYHFFVLAFSQAGQGEIFFSPFIFGARRLSLLPAILPEFIPKRFNPRLWHPFEGMSMME